MSNVGACPIKNSLMKRSFHRELLKLNFRIALSNDDKRLTEKSVSLLCVKQQRCYAVKKDLTVMNRNKTQTEPIQNTLFIIFEAKLQARHVRRMR